VDTLKGQFRATFDPAQLEQSARDFNVFERVKIIQPADLVLAFVTACCVGPNRSMAGARRAWEALTEQTIARSSFDERIDSTECVRWMWSLLAAMLASANRPLRRQWPGPMRALADILIDDSTRVNVRAALAVSRSTTPGQSALKLMGKLSLGDGQLVDVRTAAAIHHDRPLLREQDIVAGALYLRDLGFYDHRLFVAIDRHGSFFISRLKYNAKPKIEQVVLGIEGGEVVGEVLHGDLLYGPVVDVDARFNVEGEAKGHVFRVVKVEILRTNRHDKPLGGMMAFWFVTNLDRTEWPPETIALLYRLRWAVERLWRSSKHLARLDHLDTGRLTVLYVFIAASLLLQLLSDRLTAMLEERRGIGNVSRDLVLSVLIAWWSKLSELMRTADGYEHARWIRFRNMLVYDGRHPNLSQPRRITTVLQEIEDRTRALPQAA
jgi:putative transposase